MGQLCAFFKWIIDPINLTAIATVTIAIFTIVLACVTRRQAILTKQSVRIAERALTDLERAYIMPSFIPVNRDAEVWQVHILLSNFGRSFGIVKGLFAQFAEPKGLPTVPPNQGYEARPTDTVLHAGDKNWDGLAAFQMPSKQEGQIIYGYILYEDIFDRLWKNRFACEVWSEQKPGRHYYPTVGGAAYNAETRGTQNDEPNKSQSTAM